MIQLNVTPFALAFLTAISFNAAAEEFVVDQKNKSFENEGTQIKVIALKVGDVIRFKNEDPFFHNIFSLSEIKTFDLGSYPKGQSKTVTFDKTGKVEVECAIHPQMRLDVTVK